MACVMWMIIVMDFFFFLSLSNVVVVKIKVWGFIFLFICAFATLSYVKERMIELAGKRRLKSS